MRSFAVSAFVAGAFACSSPDTPPRLYPNIVFPSHITVTEGGSTTFLLLLDAPPDSELTGLLDAVDRNVAYVSPPTFDLSPTNYPVQMTVVGVDDMKAAGNRSTNFNGRVEDNGTYSGGRVQVIDKDSQNVLSTSWSIFMPPSASASFGIQLTQAPVDASTTVSLAPNGPAISVSPASLVFMPANYNVVQTVTVTSTAALGTTSIALSPTNGASSQTVAVTVTE